MSIPVSLDLRLVGPRTSLHLTLKEKEGNVKRIQGSVLITSHCFGFTRNCLFFLLLVSASLPSLTCWICWFWLLFFFLSRSCCSFLFPVVVVLADITALGLDLWTSQTHSVPSFQVISSSIAWVSFFHDFVKFISNPQKLYLSLSLNPWLLF